MELDQLVRNVVSEVVAEVMKQMQPASAPTSECIMVLAAADDSMTGRLQQLVGEQTRIVHFGDEIRGCTVGRHILPFLSCSDMADLAAGKAGTPLLNEVLRLLLNGTEVEVLEFGHTPYSQSARGPLYRLYESYVETLKSYGLVAFRHKRPESVRFWETLVTEEVVNKAIAQGAVTLEIPESARVTPLAAETAKRDNLSIRHCL